MKVPLYQVDLCGHATLASAWVVFEKLEPGRTEVTFSSKSGLVPYWSKRLGKTRLQALQVSSRGGELFCEDRGPRVSIGGRVARYLEGTIEVSD